MRFLSSFVRQKKGLTFVEVLVAVMIFSVGILASVRFYRATKILVESVRIRSRLFNVTKNILEIASSKSYEGLIDYMEQVIIQCPACCSSPSGKITCTIPSVPVEERDLGRVYAEAILTQKGMTGPAPDNQFVPYVEVIATANNSLNPLVIVGRLKKTEIRQRIVIPYAPVHTFSKLVEYDGAEPAILLGPTWTTNPADSHDLVELDARFDVITDGVDRSAKIVMDGAGDNYPPFEVKKTIEIFYTVQLRFSNYQHVEATDLLYTSLYYDGVAQFPLTVTPILLYPSVINTLVIKDVLAGSHTYELKWFAANASGVMPLGFNVELQFARIVGVAYEN